MLRKVGPLILLILAVSLSFGAYVALRWETQLASILRGGAPTLPWATTTAPAGTPTPQAAASPTVETATPPANAATETAAAPAAATSDTLQALAQAIVPPRDSRALAERLRPEAGPIPEVVNARPPQHKVGEKARFWVSNSDDREMFPVTATLRLISQHATMWVEDGAEVDQQALERSARNFDETTYPTLHQYFGSEWSPGVDGDPRIAVLNARFSGGAAAYYSSHDEISHKANPYSNEREIVYMSLESTTPGTPTYDGILAHEFQHMIHWHLDSNEDAWVNEGASELASRISGFTTSGSASSFLQQPDTQLDAWTAGSNEDALPHYGASYLWMEYFLQRLGPAALRQVIASPLNGIDGFEQVLRSIPRAPAFDDLFADWVVANALDDTSVDDGRYGYRAIHPHVGLPAVQRDVPLRDSGTVHQYGTKYISVTPSSGPLQIEFKGNPQVSVVPSEPYQGRCLWWSNRGDSSDTTLTRAFDLTGLKRATLEYALWYELEDGWDYGYVEVSTDNGATWKPLATPHTTTYDPNGNAFGPGYTGSSGTPAGSEGQAEAQWIQEKIDLTPYAGRQILLRFEMMTDDAVNLPGMCLDNISVPELGFNDDAESDAAGWQSAGFVRIDNQLPQKFVVQVIAKGKAVQVRRLQLDDQQHGTLLLQDLPPDTTQIVLAISGLTRYTTMPATYTCGVTPYTP